MFILSDLYPNLELTVGKKVSGGFKCFNWQFYWSGAIYPTAEIIERSKNASAICKTNKHLTQVLFSD